MIFRLRVVSALGEAIRMADAPPGRFRTHSAEVYQSRVLIYSREFFTDTDGTETRPDIVGTCKRFNLTHQVALRSKNMPLAGSLAFSLVI